MDRVFVCLWITKRWRSFPLLSNRTDWFLLPMPVKSVMVSSSSFFFLLEITSGAAALLLASGPKADELGLKKRARIVARVVVGSDPEMMLDGIKWDSVLYWSVGVIPATQKVLKKAGLKMNDIDVFEVNEAFGSVVLAWKKTLQPDFDKVNPNGRIRLFRLLLPK